MIINYLLVISFLDTDDFEIEVNNVKWLQVLLCITNNSLSEFLRRSLMILIIKGFRTIVFMFIGISTTFRPICSPAFFRCLSNSGT